jgi:hypothetical protein
MSTHVTASFDGERDVEQALKALTALGIEPDEVRVITPPAPEVVAGEGAGTHRGDDLAEGAAVIGLAGIGMALGGAAGTSAGSTGIGYPAFGAGAVVAGAAAGTLLGEAYGQIADLDLPEADAQLYRRRLQDGATVLAVRADGEQAAEVAEVLRRHNAGDIHGV